VKNPHLHQAQPDPLPGAALRRSYVPHWLHLGWISSTAGAAVKGDFEPRGLFFWVEKGWKNGGISPLNMGFHEQNTDFLSSLGDLEDKLLGFI